MKTRSKLFTLALFIVFTTVACTLPSIGASGEPFEDDFSSVDSGWDRVEESNFSTDYLDGYYVISVQEEDYMAWANPGKKYEDVNIAVDATYIGGGLDNHFGVICRAKDLDNFYLLMISSDGFFAIAKRIDGGSLSLLGNNRFEYSDVILQGVATNHMQADCIGDRITLTVNGSLLLEVQDSSIASGDVGLLTGTFLVPDTIVAFDNFTSSAP